MKPNEMSMSELAEWIILTSTMEGISENSSWHMSDTYELRYEIMREIDRRARDIMDVIRQEQREREEQKKQAVRDSLIEKWTAYFPKKYLFYMGGQFLIVKEDANGKTIREICEWDNSCFNSRMGDLRLEVFDYESKVYRDGKLFIGGHQFTIGKGPYKELMKQMREEG